MVPNPAIPPLLAAAKMMKMIGMALIAAGIAAIMAGMMMKKKSDDKGKKIKDEFGQKQQGEIVSECAEEEFNTGLSKSDEECKPKQFIQPESGLQQAVERERNGSFSLGNGEGVPIAQPLAPAAAKPSAPAAPTTGPPR